MTIVQLSRRSVLGTLAAGFGAGALAACGAGGATPGPEKELTQPATLQFWVNWFGASREPAYQALNGAFSQENPKITVEVPSNVNVEKLIASVVAGTPPDVATIRSTGQALAIKGAIMALDDKIAKARLFKKGDYAEAQWDQYAWKGKIYAVPSMENGARGALVYNKKLYAQAGLDGNKPPKTVDELQKAHERTTKEEGGEIKQLGFDPWDAMSMEGFLEFWGEGATGAKWYDAKALKLNLNSPEMTQAVQNFTQFRIRTGYDKIDTFRKTYGFWTGKTGGITLQTVAMQNNGYWTPGEIRVFAEPSNDVGNNLAYTWVPTLKGDKKVQLIGGWAVVLPSGSKQADVTWRYVEWLTTGKANQVLLDQFGFQNGNKNAAKELKYDHVPGLKFYIDSLTQADRIVQPINIPTFAELNTAYRAALTDVGQGKKGIKAALDDLQQQMQQLLDDTLKAAA